MAQLVEKYISLKKRWGGYKTLLSEDWCYWNAKTRLKEKLTFTGGDLNRLLNTYNYTTYPNHRGPFPNVDMATLLKTLRRYEKAYNTQLVLMKTLKTLKAKKAREHAEIIWDTA